MRFVSFFTLILFISFQILEVLIWPIAVTAGEKRTYVGISGGYGTGDFGGATRTNLAYVIGEAGYVGPSYEMSVIVPYLFLSSGDSSSQNGGMMNMTGGMGDVILKGSKCLVNLTDNDFTIDGTLSVKLPTASRDNGFGTGKTDYGVFLDIGKQIGRIKISLLPGYIFTGSTPDQTFNDIEIYGIGASMVSGHTYYQVSYEYRTALVPQTTNPQFLNGSVYHTLNDTFAVKGDVSFGLNKGAPDLGLKLGLVSWF